MKKVIIILAVFGGFFVTAFIIMRITHVISFYQVSSAANQPTYYPGNTVFASCLKEPGNGDFICFKQSDLKSASIYRCIGKAGDIIEIKNTRVFVNGKPLNEPYTWNEYDVSAKQLAGIQGYVDEHKYPLNQITDSLHSITFSANELKTYHLDLKLHVAERGKGNPELADIFKNQGFREDNLGPIKVPADSYFLLGDNRHDALDSRYKGFVKKSQIVATVVR